MYKCINVQYNLLHVVFQMNIMEWNKNVEKYKIYQAMFRVIKESENVDERQHCFLVQTAGQESRYFSMETRQDLLKVESAWHRAVCQSVSEMGVSANLIPYFSNIISCC